MKIEIEVRIIDGYSTLAKASLEIESPELPIIPESVLSHLVSSAIVHAHAHAKLAKESIGDAIEQLTPAKVAAEVEALS